MTAQKLGTIINIALLTLISYVNAHLVTTVIDQNLAFGSRPKPAALAPVEAPTTVQAAKDYSPILDKNIFGAATENQAAQGTTPDIDPNAAQHTSLNLCLVGTVVSSQADHSFASIQDLDTPNKDVNLFFVGGMIKPDVKLVKVDRQVVYFERLGYLEKLVLCEEGKPRPVDAQPQTASYSPPAPSGPTAPPQQVAPGQYRLDRNTVNEHLSNLSTLLTQARVVPHFDKGKPDGFRIFSIRPDSLFDQIGIKNGDVLRRINGLNITTTEEALQAFTQLKAASRLSLDLERDGSAQSFNYDIR
ncbi:MAG: hypothetical protein HYT87_03235 [Nitrospirae bacterium]|nr:hypothetical protein [Nitrospirota bacterium]